MPIDKEYQNKKAQDATEKVLMEGGSSTDKANRLPGETASEANKRITEAYKNLTAKPVLSQEQIDAGAKVQFVRTGAGGKGEWTVVVPPGYKGSRTTTQWTDGIIPGGSKYTTGSSVGTKISGGNISTATANPKGGKTEGTGSKFQNTFSAQQAARMEKLRADAAAGKKITLQDLGDFRTIYYDRDPVTGKQRTGKEVVDAMLADLNLVDPNELLKSGGTTLVNEQTKEVRPQNLAEIKQNILEQIAYEAKSQSRYSSYAKDVYNYLKGNASQGIRGILAKDPALWKGGYSPADVGKIVAGKSSDPNDKRSVYILDPNNPVIPKDILAQIEGQNIPIIDPTTGNAVGFDPRTGSVVDFGGVLGRVTPRPGYDYLKNYVGDTQIDASGNIVDASGNIVQSSDNMLKDFGAGSNMSFDDMGNPIEDMYSQGSDNLGVGSKGYADRKSAYDLLYAQFKQYGLESLVEGIKDLITSNVSPSEFSIRLQDTDAYKKRFAANQDRIKQGLRALTPAEYIGLEDQYQNIMRNYGLPASYYTKDAMGTQSGFNKFIANDVSAAELEDRIATAQKRVINADVNTKDALRKFYPDITDADILAYTLDPTNALENIKRKVTAAEIGGAAMAQGFNKGTTPEEIAAYAARANELAGYGITKAQAQQGYQTIGEVLPAGQKLADIYEKQGLGPYSQLLAEQEVFGTQGAVDAARKRRKLAELEKSTFMGTSGVAQGALARDRAGGY